VNDQMILEPAPRVVRAGQTIRQCSVIRLDEGKRVRKDTLWFEMPERHGLFEDDDCDVYLIAMLMDAMTEGRELVVKGAVSQRLLSNLTEYQAIWSTWVPEVYHEVAIEVDRFRVIPPHQTTVPRRAVCAFSGGVDAAFTVWRHARRQVGYRSQDIDCCALFHGFDIDLGDREAFDRVLEQTRKTLEDLRIEIVPLATNYREISRADWRYAHGGALVSALACFRPQARIGLLASGEPYDHLAIPWGSSPVCDPLLGSDDFEVMHDGASFSRTEKVVALAEWPIGRESLRVCWEGRLAGENCGQCEKCVRTALNFVVGGQQVPAGLPDRERLWERADHLFLATSAARREWELLHEAAAANGVDRRYVRAIRKVLAKKSRPRKSKVLKRFFKRLRQ
jgi:hypothetical protein